MAEAGKTSTDSNNLGVTFKNKNAQSAKAEDAAMSELYGRSLSAISKPGQAQVQASFNVENAFSGKSSEAGTFVSDRKKDRPSFFENVASAFSEWRTMTVRSLIDHNILEEKKNPEKTNRSETVHAILSESAIQDVPTISALKQDTIEEKPRREIINAEPVIKKSSTMLDVTKEAQASIVSRSASTSSQKIRTHELQKVRTFKSDAALLQPDVAPESPEVPAALMHEPEAPAPEPKFKAEEAHVVPIDMRASMIAPEVSMHIDTEVVSTPPKKSEVLQSEKIEAVAPDVSQTPHTLSENVPVSIPETESQWTHVLDADTSAEEIPLSEIKSLPPLPQRDAPPVFSSNTPAAFEELRAFDIPELTPQEPTPPVPHKDRLVRVAEKIRSLQPSSETSPDPVPRSETKSSSALSYVDRPLSELGDTVKPDAEPVFIATPIVSDITPHASLSEDKPVFHARTAPVRTPLVQNNEAKNIITPPEVAATPAPVRVPETGIFARFAVRIILILCVTGTVMVSGAYLFTRVKPEPGTTPVRTDPAPVIPDEGPAQFILTVDSPTLLTDVQQVITAAPLGLNEFTMYTGEPPRAATTQEFFDAIDTNMLPRTVRALEPVFVIGSITTTKNEPFIRIRSNNFDALFAGLLAWEPSMQQELAPLFGTRDTETTSFTDAVRDNKSIRILRDASGNEVMLYSFIDNRTVVITTSGEALSKLIEQF